MEDHKVWPDRAMGMKRRRRRWVLLNANASPHEMGMEMPQEGGDSPVFYWVHIFISFMFWNLDSKVFGKEKYNNKENDFNFLKKYKKFKFLKILHVFKILIPI